jgi:hypothetical protein
VHIAVANSLAFSIELKVRAGNSEAIKGGIAMMGAKGKGYQYANVGIAIRAEVKGFC